MNPEEIQKSGKLALRSLCRQHGVSYSRLTVDGMRKALLAKLTKSDDYVRERLSDPVVVQVVRKVTAPSVLDLLKLIPVGDTFSCKEIAKRTGSTEASVRTIIGNCNSTAPSNARFHRTGLRFASKRGEDTVVRTK